MTPEEYIKAGQVDEALTGLQDAVRKAPADPKLRRFLFQLHCIMGRWEKALTQLQVLADMDIESKLLAEIFRPVLGCETLRLDVFAGNRTPLIFGEPEEWIGWMVQANQMAAKGQFAQAQELQERALEAAPAVAGQANGQDFEWIADEDSRLGPILEAYIDSKYYWIPMSRITKAAIEKPADLRDLVWVSAQFVWTNGGEASGFIPVRYPGSEASTDGGIRLARKTEWDEKSEGMYFGLGQRTFATNGDEVALLQLRTLDFPAVPAPPAV